MKKLLPIVFTLLLSDLCSTAQSLSPFVVSSSGGFYSNSSGQLSFTTAEMTMVTTLSAGNSILTQGFQQSFDFPTTIENHGNFPFLFNVYPNPGNGYFNLAVEAKDNSPLQLTLHDVIGKTIWQKDLKLIAGRQVIPVQFSQFAAGVYLLELTTLSNRIFQKIQITK